MKCPNCDSILSLKNNRCDRCGEDVRVYKRVVKASNAYYNQGLSKAKVRDLSGAAAALRTSLELNKRNTNARNLLGLVYYEMGETVSALSEWVLSKHFQSNDNDADELMSMVQSNPTKLENINQAIKKYNTALQSAKQGSNDLAIIQLKKVISLNPKFIRAFQLLALLYINEGEKDKATRLLLKARSIDVNNTLTLRYLKELGVNNTKQVNEVKEAKQEEGNKSNPEYTVFSGMNSYKEDKPNIWAYLNLVIGIVIGMAALYFLVVPTISNKANEELKESNLKLSNQVSTLTSEKTSLENKNADLTKQVEELQAQLNITPPSASTEPGASSDTLTEEQSISQLLSAAFLYMDNKKEEAALELVNVDPNVFTLETAKTVYNTIKDASFDSVAQSLYSYAHSLYSKNKFEEALPIFLQANSLKEDYEDAQYFIGRCYHRLEQYDKAREYYEALVENHPTSKRGKEAATQLRSLPNE